ncbi:class I SAM-dependent methyltransferase [Aliidiomarina minuta]|nr:class I SAM-dependent methyltransferase [Aliidiomarina minuta]
MLIKPALIEQVLTSPKSWQQLPHGKWLQRLQREALQPHWASMAGNYALQLGPLSNGVAGGCKAIEKITVHNSSDARVRADLSALPFARRSIDIVVMAHVLEYQKDPHQVLREADRVLAFDGYMVLTLYNPLSLASLTGLWPGNRHRPPWSGRYFSKGRIQDWLGLLNYEVVVEGYLGNSALSSLSKDPERGTSWLLQQAPVLRCCYYIVARKRVFPLKLQPSFLRFAQPAQVPGTAQARSHFK